MYNQQKDDIYTSWKKARPSSQKMDRRKEKLGGFLKEWLDSEYDWKTSTVKALKVKKEQLYDEFGVEPKFRHLANINQGSVGACTLMAISHLMEMEKVGLANDKKAWAKHKKSGWRTMFKRLERMVENEYGQPEPRFYADTLDVGVGNNVSFFKKLTSLPEFHYVPVKSTEFREQIVNPIFVSAENKKQAKARFGPLYDQGPITCGVGNFIEDLIDRGHGVAIAFNGHARVIIGYDETRLLFQDSFGRKYYGKNSYNDEEYYGGISIVNDKFLTYKYVRDMCYFDNSF